MLEDKSRWGNMPYLLVGWSGRKDPRGIYIDGEASKWKPDMRAVKATVEFATKVERFYTKSRVGARTIGGARDNTRETVVRRHRKLGAAGLWGILILETHKSQISAHGYAVKLSWKATHTVTEFGGTNMDC